MTDTESKLQALYEAKFFNALACGCSEAQADAIATKAINDARDAQYKLRREAKINALLNDR